MQMRLWWIYFYLREINACENTQDKNACDNEHTQGKNLLPYNLLYSWTPSQVIGM